MRQKKSGLIYYVIGVVILAAIIFAAVHEVPLQSEHVETAISVSK